MSVAEPYRVPWGVHRSEMLVVNSRFVTTIGKIESVAEAKTFLAQVRTEMPDASHHVYAFRVGYGKSVIEGMSDDGEPSGTAGPPALAVLRGTDIGDIIVVVTRFFGGTKLGTGGLVRAYTEAVKEALKTLQTEEKIKKQVLGVEVPYSLYELTRNLIVRYDGRIDDTVFEADVTLIVTLAETSVPRFTSELRELSAGKVIPVVLGDV